MTAADWTSSGGLGGYHAARMSRIARNRSSRQGSDNCGSRPLSIDEWGRYPPTVVDAVLISRVKTLSVAERLELIGAVWETLSGTDVPVSDEEKALLDARLADAAENPEDESPWAEVQARLRKQLP